MTKHVITKDTTLCISLAERPGSIGTTLFNAAFEKKKLDFIYKAFQLDARNLPVAIEAIRALGIRGVGLSMPHKEAAITLVDSLDPMAKKIGAINTIVNTKGKLKGYNTDAYGAGKLLSSVKGIKEKSVVVLGAGGVAKAITAALNKLKVKDVVIVTKEPAEAKQLAEARGYKAKPWPHHQTTQADVFINATPIGMAPHEEKSPLETEAIKNYKIILDVVTNPQETLLQKEAKKQKKRVLPGIQMALHQATIQFELYTGKKAPVTLMKKQLTNVNQ